MKSIILTLILVSSFLIAQPHQRNSRDKLEQLEKIKLIEILNLDEETSIKFFARKNNFENENRELFKKREEILGEFGREVVDGKIDWDEDKIAEKYDEIWKIEKKIFNNRMEFYKSLDDLLTPEQRLKLLGFEHQFRREIQRLMKRKSEL